MADIEKNINEEEMDEYEAEVLTLVDTETGEEHLFEFIAEATIEGKLYYAILPLDEDTDEFYVFQATEKGDDLDLDPIEDEDEYENVVEYFNDLLLNDIDYDK